MTEENFGCSATGKLGSKPSPSTLPQFNPSGKAEVEAIKGLTEQILAYLRDNVPANRERSIAITNYEQAAMWAVKANFT
mgnify:CR=1 FL=1